MQDQNVGPASAKIQRDQCQQNTCSHSLPPIYTYTNIAHPTQTPRGKQSTKIWIHVYRYVPPRFSNVHVGSPELIFGLQNNFFLKFESLKLEFSQNRQKLVLKMQDFFPNLGVGSLELFKKWVSWGVSGAKKWIEKGCQTHEGGTSPYHLPM